MTQDKTPDKNAECREAFEKWNSDGDANCMSIVRQGDGYRLMQTNHAWLAWQAAWNTRVPAQETGQQDAENIDKRKETT